MQKSDQPSADDIRKSFLGADGQYYSFVDFDKEFKAWLKTSVLDSFTRENLLDATFDVVFTWNDDEGWLAEPRDSFIQENFEAIRSRLSDISAPNFFSGDNVPFLHPVSDYEAYFSECGEYKYWLFPTQLIVIDHEAKGRTKQDHFGFIRTSSGYKLIQVTFAEN